MSNTVDYMITGRKSPLFSAIRGNMFKAKKDACVNETNACPLQVFSPDTKSEKERFTHVTTVQLL